MRLPKDEEGNILQEEVTRMVDAFMKSGMNYFDTAYAYAGSEASMKKALVDRYPRESFTIADKLPAWKLKSEEDVERNCAAWSILIFIFFTALRPAICRLMRSITVLHFSRR